MRKLFLLLLLFNTTLVFAKENPLPNVNFEYGYFVDSLFCSPSQEYPMTDEMLNELSTRQDEFKSYWHTHGDSLLQSTVEIFDQPFQHEIMANFILCNIDSTSYPLLINMRKYLSSWNEPYPKEYFVYLTYHMFLFHYIIENYPTIFDNSVLLKKYQNDTQRVRNHLFPHAIIAAVYEKEDRVDELQALIKRASAKDADEMRAWQIVKDIEGYTPFINELKEQPRSNIKILPGQFSY